MVMAMSCVEMMRAWPHKSDTTKGTTSMQALSTVATATAKQNSKVSQKEEGRSVNTHADRKVGSEGGMDGWIDRSIKRSGRQGSKEADVMGVISRGVGISI